MLTHSFSLSSFIHQLTNYQTGSFIVTGGGGEFLMCCFSLLLKPSD